MKIGDKVKRKGLPVTGTITRDLGVRSPEGSNAPLASHSRPEQAWMVEFTFDVPLSDGRRGYTDQQGCWESDIELATE